MHTSLERMRYRGVLIKISRSANESKDDWKIDITRDENGDPVVEVIYSNAEYREAALKATRKTVKQFLKGQGQAQSPIYA